MVLTPLYHRPWARGDALCCELLLHDHAQLGTTDENGWQEVHQVGGGAGAGPRVRPVESGLQQQRPSPGLHFRARAALGTSFSEELTWGLRTPLGTQPCTSVLSTTRSVCMSAHR